MSIWKFPKFNFNSKQKWNVVLITGAVLICIVFFWFTNFLVNELSKDEMVKVQKLADAFLTLNDPEIKDYTPFLATIQSDKSTKIIITNDDGKIRLINNYPESLAKDSIYLYNELKQMKLFTDPIRIQLGENSFEYVYYKERAVITLLRFYPYLQLLLIFLFLSIAYVGFSSSRRFEQNKVWVGMAKETAHQIGTPLSSLLGWIEILRISEGKPNDEALDEMNKDLIRLQIITERFSKIGSTPEIVTQDVIEVLQDSIDYLKGRISKKVRIITENKENEPIFVKINRNLFSWVIENLTKNAVDAMTGEGQINFTIKKLRGDVIIDVRDTGKGIPKTNYKTVFEPGFTTRKRGWGLGLSLAKRIIEEYHNGRIFIKDSEINKGTCFRIVLAEVPIMDNRVIQESV